MEKEGDVDFLGNEFFESATFKFDSKETDKRKNEPNQIAKVGFWKFNSVTKNFSCYHQYTIPSPVKKPVKDDDTAVFYEVLFSGDDNSLFYFTKEDGIFSVCILEQPPSKTADEESLNNNDKRVDHS